MRDSKPLMRCTLELRSPASGTGTADTWSFSGTDERLLHECLVRLDRFAVTPPLEEWDRHALRHEIRNGARWRAAMLLWPDEPADRNVIDFQDRRADAAWTAEGALRLAELLPERFDDVRDAINTRLRAADSTALGA